MTATPDSIEGTVIIVVRWVKLGVEIFGAGLVTLGVCVAIVQLIRNLAARKPADFTATRLILARHLALALEFELGADILGTAVSPSWDQIGKLGAVQAVARIKPANRPARGPNILRPSTQTPSTVAAPANAETSRAPNGLSPTA